MCRSKVLVLDMHLTCTSTFLKLDFHANNQRRVKDPFQTSNMERSYETCFKLFLFLQK